MNSKYRVYVCPEPKCPAMGKKGSSCPTHGRTLNSVIVRVVDEKAEAQAKKNVEALEKLKAMQDKNLDGSPRFGGLDALSDFLRGWSP